MYVKKSFTHTKYDCITCHYEQLYWFCIRIIINAQLYDRAKIHCVTNFVFSLKRTTTHMNYESIVNCPWDQYREEFS